MITELHSPTPPPVPKRPETIRTSADKQVLPYAVTPVSIMTKENMKQASHVDLINEKRRLAVELEDAKQKRILKRDIKQLRKQIELLENGILSRIMRKPTFWFLDWSDTSQAVQLQEMASGLKFRI